MPLNFESVECNNCGASEEKSIGNPRVDALFYCRDCGRLFNLNDSKHQPLDEYLSQYEDASMRTPNGTDSRIVPAEEMIDVPTESLFQKIRNRF